MLKHNTFASTLCACTLLAEQLLLGKYLPSVLVLSECVEVCVCVVYNGIKC